MCDVDGVDEGISDDELYGVGVAVLEFIIWNVPWQPMFQQELPVLMYDNCKSFWYVYNVVRVSAMCNWYLLMNKFGDCRLLECMLALSVSTTQFYLTVYRISQCPQCLHYISDIYILCGKIDLRHLK